MNLSAQKTRHVNAASATTKPNAMHAFSFCQLSRDASESLGSACSSSCSADEILMWSRFESVKERRHGPAESLALFSNDWFNLTVCVDLFTHITYMLYSINVCRNFTFLLLNEKLSWVLVFRFLKKKKKELFSHFSTFNIKSKKWVNEWYMDWIGFHRQFLGIIVQYLLFFSSYSVHLNSLSQLG